MSDKLQKALARYRSAAKVRDDAVAEHERLQQECQDVWRRRNSAEGDLRQAEYALLQAAQGKTTKAK